jgi:hypothetical protein
MHPHVLLVINKLTMGGVIWDFVLMTIAIAGGAASIICGALCAMGIDWPSRHRAIAALANEQEDTRNDHHDDTYCQPNPIQPFHSRVPPSSKCRRPSMVWLSAHHPPGDLEHITSPAGFFTLSPGGGEAAIGDMVRLSQQ